MIRTYSELIELPTFEERFYYLSLDGKPGTPIFDHERYLNQKFYRSREWKSVRRDVVLRDLGCDLAIPDRPLRSVMVHHMNPIRPEDLEEFNPDILDPEYLITTTHQTHNAIHYGDISLLPTMPVERRPFDQVPWR